MEKGKVFNVHQAARHLETHRQAVYRLLRTGQLQGAIMNGQWCIRKEDLDEYIRTKKNTGTPGGQLSPL